MPTRTSGRWPLLVALVAVLVHGRSLDNGFARDDLRLVESSPEMVSVPRSPSPFVEPCWDAPGVSGAYRPLTVASVAINRMILGAGPLGFHLVNVILHAAVAALAWLTLRRAGTHYGTALLGGLLFAVLPVHTEAVLSLAGRAELLAALFVLAAWLAHRSANEAGASEGRWRLGAASLYFAALLASGSTVLAPLLFFADDALRRGDTAPRRGRLLVGYAVAAVLALASMLALREVTIPLDNPAAAAGAWPRVLTAVWIQLKYALLCLAPRHLVSDYSFDAIALARSPADPRVLAGFAFVAALVATAVWGWRSSRPMALAVLVWVVFFLPSANIVFPTGTLMAERLAYLPSLGVCLAIGHLGAAFAEREGRHGAKRTRQVAVVMLAAIVVSGFAARTWLRIPDWKSNLALTLADVATQPRSAKLQAGAGVFLAEAGRVAEAEEHLRRAIAIFPEYAPAHRNLAVLLARRGAHDEAAEHRLSGE